MHVYLKLMLVHFLRHDLIPVLGQTTARKKRSLLEDKLIMTVCHLLIPRHLMTPSHLMTTCHLIDITEL